MPDVDALITRTHQRAIEQDRLTRGDELVILSVGDVCSEFTGRPLAGNVTSTDQLDEMVKYFNTVQKPTGQLPLIDFNHRAIGNSEGASLEEQIALGACLSLRREGDDLYAVPGWTAHGRAIIDKAEGTLYPSATYILDPVFDRATPDTKVADAALFAFAVTTTPATRVDKLGAIRNAAAAATMEVRRMTVDELRTGIDGLDEEARNALLAGYVAADAPEEEQPEDAAPVEARAADDEDEEDDERVERSAPAALVALVKEQGKRLAAVEARDRKELRSICAKVKPVMRPAAERVFDAAPTPEQGAADVAELFKSEMVDTSTISRSGGRDKAAADAPPSDENGFAEYVQRNLKDGETFSDGLARIRTAFPDNYRAAVAQKGGRRG